MEASEQLEEVGQGPGALPEQPVRWQEERDVASPPRSSPHRPLAASKPPVFEAAKERGSIAPRQPQPAPSCQGNVWVLRPLPRNRGSAQAAADRGFGGETPSRRFHPPGAAESGLSRGNPPRCGG